MIWLISHRIPQNSLKFIGNQITFYPPSTDGAAMLSNILFAWSKGTLLDIDAKCWRLFADVMNDVAMFVDLLSPLAPPYMFSGLMCITTVFRVHI